MTDLSAARLTKLSPAALKFLRAYVYGMALQLSVDDNEGVHPDVLGILAGAKDRREIKSALTELEDAEVVNGFTEPRGGPCVWITPDGIRRAVDEGFVEMSLAWTLWPHDDSQYEAVINESMGDANDFDWKAAQKWGDAVCDMLDDETYEKAVSTYRKLIHEV